MHKTMYFSVFTLCGFSFHFFRRFKRRFKLNGDCISRLLLSQLFILGMSDLNSRPAIATKRDNMDEYDTIFVGFPIWWYVAPTIINTFLESYNLKGKTIIPFATSGGSGMGKTNEKLAPSCTGAKLLHGKVFNAYSSKADLSAWVETLNL